MVGACRGPADFLKVMINRLRTVIAVGLTLAVTGTAGALISAPAANAAEVGVNVAATSGVFFPFFGAAWLTSLPATSFSLGLDFGPLTMRAASAATPGLVDLSLFLGTTHLRLGVWPALPPARA